MILIRRLCALAALGTLAEDAVAVSAVEEFGEVDLTLVAKAAGAFEALLRCAVDDRDTCRERVAEPLGSKGFQICGHPQWMHRDDICYGCWNEPLVVPDYRRPEYAGVEIQARHPWKAA